MKIKKTYIVEAIKIFINCITLPLYFIKFFCDEAVLPGYDENGEEIIGRFCRYYSIFGKIDREGIAYLVWGAISIICISIALSVLSMIFKKENALKIASHVVFGIAIALFFVLLFIAMSIQYNY